MCKSSKKQAQKQITRKKTNPARGHLTKSSRVKFTTGRANFKITRLYFFKMKLTDKNTRELQRFYPTVWNLSLY